MSNNTFLMIPNDWFKLIGKPTGDNHIKQITHLSLCVLAIVDSWKYSDSDCYMTDEQIGERLHISARAVQSNLKALESCGLIQRKVKLDNVYMKRYRILYSNVTS